MKQKKEHWSNVLGLFGLNCNFKKLQYLVNSKYVFCFIHIFIMKKKSSLELEDKIRYTIINSPSPRGVLLDPTGTFSVLIL